MKQISIDHIEITDRLIEVNYWVSKESQKEAVLFKTKEFERWLCGQRAINLNQYWTNWDPRQDQSYGHRIIWSDLEKFFFNKMRALSVDAIQDFSLSGKKPMTRAGSKPSQKKSKSA